MPGEVTQTEFARIKKCSRSAVTQAISSGRIAPAIREIGNKRLLDLDMATELWEKNTLRNNTSKPPRRIPKPSKAKPSSVTQKLKRDIDALPDDAIPDLNLSRARREHYEAEFSKLKVAKEKKDLVAAKDVKKTAFAVGRSIRETLMNTADRLAHQLAGETDATLIHKMLTDEHRAALEQLEVA
tara:strand:- start:6573 stop:7124 length:552 start_codon:yes stop_codon:yes gene_type:complete